VLKTKKIDTHTNRATRLRFKINIEMTASAIIAKQKTRDRSIENSVQYLTGIFSGNSTIPLPALSSPAGDIFERLSKILQLH
jgi:hypothetical protein